MTFRTLAYAIVLLAASVTVPAQADTLTTFSGTVALPPGQPASFDVVVYRGNSLTDPQFAIHRVRLASTQTDSDGHFIIFVPDLAASEDVTVRAKNSALRLGGERVLEHPTAGAWPDDNNGISIKLGPQSDPNFGIQNNRYAFTTMTFVTDRAPGGSHFKNTGAPDQQLTVGSFIGHVALGNGQAISGQCGLASGWQCNGPLTLNDDAYIDSLKTEATGAGAGASIVAAAAAARGHTVLLFVHGYNNTFDQGAGLAARLSYLMEPAPHETIYYSWPSAAKVLGYPQDQKNAELSAVNLVKVLDALSNGPNPPKIVLAAHSMGSYALTTALYLWALMHPTRQHVFGEMVLFAGDVDAALWNARKDDIARVVDHIAFYTNANDQALHMSTCVMGDSRPRIGQITSWLPPVAGFDATKVASSDGFGHGYLVGSTTVASSWHADENGLPAGPPSAPLRKTPWLADGGGSWLNTGKLAADTICRLYSNTHF